MSDNDTDTLLDLIDSGVIRIKNRRFGDHFIMRFHDTTLIDKQTGKPIQRSDPRLLSIRK